MKISSNLLKRLFLALLLLTGSEVLGSTRQEYATPGAVHIVRYPREVSCLFVSGRKYEIVHKDSASSRYYLSFPGETDYIVLLEDKRAREYDTTESIKDSDGKRGHSVNVFAPRIDFTVEADYAYLIFSPETQYPIRSQDESTYKLEYRLGDTLLAVGVPKEGFRTDDYKRSGFELTTSLDEMEPRQAICTLKNARGRTIGYGTLVREGGQIYCLVPQETLTNHREVKILSYFEVPIETTALELESERNLARFHVYGDRYALRIAREPNFDEDMLIKEGGSTRKSKVIGKDLTTGNLLLTEMFDYSGIPLVDQRGKLVAIAEGIQYPPKYAYSSTEYPKNLAIPLSGEFDWIPVSHLPHSDNEEILHAEHLLREFESALIRNRIFRDENVWEFAVNPERHQYLPASKLFSHPLFDKWLSYKTANHKRRLRLAKTNPGYDSRSAYSDNREKSWKFLANLLRSFTYKFKDFNPSPPTNYLETRKQIAVDRLEEVYKIILTSDVNNAVETKARMRIQEISREFRQD